MNKNCAYILFALTVLAGCENRSSQTDEIADENMTTFEDPHSYARPEEARITHLSWKADIDFSEQIITATATWTFERNENADSLFLDTQDLEIIDVTYPGGEQAPFTLGKSDSVKGTPLSIRLPEQGNEVAIRYRTLPKAAALQWLSPQQTADGRSPFLFTQSQAILARSWVPVQDSPGIRFTYTAQVSVPQGLLALMSAENPQQADPSGTYYFSMEQPIPAYLLALAVGDLKFEPLGPRSGVYAEPSVIASAAYEFEELENMIQAAESLYGPYQWDRYDLLVLPPSFPFGGMENPRLTFATPTILAGDRSLTSLVAHELAHSWSGNLVTNATWNDFWLNEGFTVYFEQRIMEELYGQGYSEMLASLEVGQLKNEINEMMSDGRDADTHLKLNLDGRNPDEGMTEIAYQKGYLFLRYLEDQAGREQFDKFLKDYFSRNAFKVMTTEKFLEEVREYLIDPGRLNIGMVKLREWIYKPGIPEDAVLPVSNRFDSVNLVLSKFLQGKPAEDLETSAWSSHEWVHFIRELPNDLSGDQMAALDAAFGLTKSGNSEVLTAWLTLAIQTDYEPAFDRLESFLVNTGRRKFLMPLYGELIKKDGTKNRALSIYEKARPNYHYVAMNSVDELLSYEATN